MMKYVTLLKLSLSLFLVAQLLELSFGQGGLLPTKEELLKETEEAFRNLDLNENGVIEEDEIHGMMKRGFVDTERNKLKRVESDMDKLEQRVEAIFKQKEEQMKRVAKNLLEADDINKDHVISFEEYAKARKGHFDKKRKGEL